MKKALSIFVSASIAAAWLFQATAAPVASNRTGAQGSSALEEVSPPVTLPAHFPKVKTVGYTPVQGLRQTVSPAMLQNKRAEASATAASRAIAADVDLRGSIIWPNTMWGFYKFPKEDGGAFTPFTNHTGYINGGGYDDGEGIYRGVYYTSSTGGITNTTLFTLDAADMEILDQQLLPNNDLVAVDIEMDPTTGEVYGCYYDNDGMYWGRGNYHTATRTTLRTLPQEDWLAAVGCDSNGQFYGMTISSAFVKINKLTGEFERIAMTDVPYYYSCGGCVDDAHGKFLVSYNTDYHGAGIYEIDLVTGQASRTVDFQQDVISVGLYISKSAQTGKVPAAPELTVTPVPASMAVAYTIVIPSTLGDGTPLSGNLDWSIIAGGNIVAQGNAPAGQSVSGTITMPASGSTEFIATAANAAGVSPRTYQTVFVGYGLPLSPDRVWASYADGKVKIGWTPVTSVADDGYFDPAAVSYNVTFDGESVATGVTDAGYEFEMTKPDVITSFTYSVSATYEGQTSPATSGEPLWIGAYPTPFDVTFNSYTIYDDMGFTIIDANQDGHTWAILAYGRGAFYPYDSTHSGDDWMITPALHLEAGKIYPFNCVTYADNPTYPERIEVKGGTAPTAEAMTTTIVSPTQIAVGESKPMVLSGVITPDVTGDYYVGLHAISDADCYWLVVSSMSVGEGIVPDAPVAVGDLLLTPEPTGALTLSGSFTMPVKNAVGQNLSGNITAKVTRGDKLVATLSGQPGAAVTFTDGLPSAGDYTYTVTPYLGETPGAAVSGTVYVGPYAPEAPVKAEITETSTPGRVTVTWQAPSVDINGNQLDPSALTYIIYTIDDDRNLHQVTDQPVSGDSYTFDALADPSVQEFVQVAVRANNRGVQSSATANSQVIPAGVPYKLPILYTGSAELSTQIMGINAAGSAIWGLYSPRNLEDAPAPVKGDDYFGCYAGAQEFYGDLFTGKIDLTDAERPELSFYTYKLNDSDVNFLQVFVIVDGRLESIGYAQHSKMDTGVWTKVRFKLDAYKGKSVQVQVRAVAKSMAYTFVDAIMVKETPDKDLAAVSLTAPAVVRPSEKFPLSLTIANYGYLDASDYEVSLYRDGDLVATRDGVSIAPDAKTTIDFEDMISYFDEDPVEAHYSAEIIFDGDKDDENNATPEITVTREVTDLPAVTDLAGEVTDRGVHLTWTKYVVEDLQPVEITETFEGAPSWALDGYNHWTFVDVDKMPVKVFWPLPDIPGLTGDTPLASFIVFDQGADEYLMTQSPFNGHSGTKYLAALLNNDKQPNDDWAISPLLSGQQQTISFYAKSFSVAYRDSFELYYTTEDSTDPADYICLGLASQIAAEWTKYEETLPAGAMHFAIRYMSTDCYMLMIDDVTFTPNPYLDIPTLIGYDVYRDGVKINAEPVTEGEYLDTEAPAGKHTYHVVARYHEGYSELSNPVSLSGAGVDITLSDMNITVTVEGRDIVIDGATDDTVSIFTVDGKLIRHNAGNLRLTVAPAVYIVKAGTLVTKVIVK